MEHDAALGNGRIGIDTEKFGRAARADWPPALYFMMIELAGFKRIDGRFGRHAGDLALKQVRWDLPTLEQVVNITDQVSCVAKKTGRDAWVGIYVGECGAGAPANPVEKIGDDLDEQVALGVVRIASSIQGPLLLRDRREVR